MADDGGFEASNDSSLNSSPNAPRELPSNAFDGSTIRQQIDCNQFKTICHLSPTSTFFQKEDL